jgi:hypothetical protein
MNKHAAITIFVVVLWGLLTSQSYGACDYYLYQPLIFEDGKIEGCINKKELDSLLNRKVQIGSSDSDAYEFLSKGDKGDERIRVENCSQYVEAKAKGFTAFSTFDMSMESFFIRTWTVLVGLKKSSPPKKDYMNIKSYPELDKFPAFLLPVAIQSEANELMSEGRSFRDYIKSGDIKINKSEKSFSIIYRDMDKDFELVAKSDFNHDGYADMLIFTASHSLSGSWRAYGYILISAREEGQKMYDVATDFDPFK